VLSVCADGAIAMFDRNAEIKRFLADAGWGDADIQSFPGDASSRRYFRLTRGDERAVLQNAPRGAESPAEPEGASVADRQALGYNALARLAGPEPAAFATVANELTIRGFSAPKILAAELDAGLILLEDFGQSVYARVIENDTSLEAPLYEAAVECLAEIYRSSFPAQMQYRDTAWRVREYDDVALLTETHLFLDWYANDKDANIDVAARSTWDRIWESLFVELNTHTPGLALRDFHAENLFWLPERQSVSKVGLIDFQDGLFAHPAYDLVSFLEDARRDVSPHLVDGLIEQFIDQAKLQNPEAFRRAYAVLGAQRNAKILGIFIRLAERDGKPAYRDLIPRVHAHFRKNLQGDIFAELRDWFAEYLPGEIT
jgi:aminoglycoside/choline kinase family phosphotransferase